MKQFSYVMTRPVAPHARPVGKLIKEASRFASSIRLNDGASSAELGRDADVVKMNLRCGNEITVTVEGRDEEAAVAAIQNYMVANF
ncbi:MAG: HPr family phosphocarrier protein [Clostridia bacterium]|nr:HPr family phosphocarrier protein [Clostridia bacterium]